MSNLCKIEQEQPKNGYNIYKSCQIYAKDNKNFKQLTILRLNSLRVISNKSFFDKPSVELNENNQFEAFYTFIIILKAILCKPFNYEFFMSKIVLNSLEL